MHYHHIVDYCLDTSLEGAGISKARLDTILAQLSPVVQGMAARKDKAAAPVLDIVSTTDDLDIIESFAAGWRGRFKTIVVAGTGGSGLSGRTLTQMKRRAAMEFHYLENIDPDRMDDVLAQLDLEQSGFLIISKSGTTVETISQYYVLLEYIESRLGKEKAREHFAIITQADANPLRQSAQAYGMRVLDHPGDIGGRFAILSTVGLLPAALAGLDIRALRRGAQAVVQSLSNGCAPAVGAALQCAFIEKKYPLTVMLPYAERLSGFSAWYRQIWAESLGKQGKGSTPIRAVGATDQHSQLQLYLDGPKDKLFHMIMLNRKGTGQPINLPDVPGLEYLRGKTVGDVMAAEQQATFETLVRNHCPVRLFTLESLEEEQMGALLMHFMLEVIFVAALLEVNPFDQPAVEEGKLLARDYLRTGNL